MGRTLAGMIYSVIIHGVTYTSLMMSEVTWIPADIAEIAGNLSRGEPLPSRLGYRESHPAPYKEVDIL